MAIGAPDSRPKSLRLATKQSRRAWVPNYVMHVRASLVSRPTESESAECSSAFRDRVKQVGATLEAPSTLDAISYSKLGARVVPKIPTYNFLSESRIKHLTPCHGMHVSAASTFVVRAPIYETFAGDTRYTHGNAIDR